MTWSEVSQVVRGQVLLATAATPVSIAGFLNGLVTWANAGSAIGLMFALFLIWRTTSTKVTENNRRTEATTLRTLEEALRAATLRADAEAARADQQTHLCSALEVKNIELLNSSVVDQTRHLVIEKTLGAKIVELKRQLGKSLDED